MCETNVYAIKNDTKTPFSYRWIYLAITFYLVTSTMLLNSPDKKFSILFLKIKRSHLLASAQADNYELFFCCQMFSKMPTIQ